MPKKAVACTTIIDGEYKEQQNAHRHICRLIMITTQTVAVVKTRFHVFGPQNLRALHYFSSKCVLE